jgi:uncharacterized protein
VPRYLVVPPASGKSTEPLICGDVDGTGTERILLGRLNEQGPLRPVYMDVTAESVVAIFGKRGSGKSYTLGVLAEGLCAGQGTTGIATNEGRRGILLLDTLNIFWSLENPLITEGDKQLFRGEVARLHSWNLSAPELNVTVWIPRGFRRNYTPEHYRNFGIAPSELSSDDLADLVEVDPQRDLIGQLLAEAREKSAQAHGAFSLEQLLNVIETDQELREYYAEGTLRGARQRVRALSRLDLFREGTPLGDLLKPGRLSVLELGEVPNSLRAVISAALLRRIHAERAQASDAEKQLALNTRLSEEERVRLSSFVSTAIPPCWVLVDEAQNILPGSREIKSTDAVVRFVREGRNFGLSFALTTQQPSAVDQRILAQADTVICHKLTVAQDIGRMKDNLKSAEPTEVKVAGSKLDLPAWLRSLEPGTAIVTNTEYERIFSLEVRPRVTPHGGTGFQVRESS